MFHGSMVALVTPMHPDGSLDHSGLERLVELQISEGSDGIVVMGTTGESATFDHDEHCAVVREVVRLVRGRIPVVAGTGSNSTSEAITLTRCAMEDGADACLLVTPYYNKPTQEGLFLHYKAVAEAVAIPQILYNVPGRTACDMLPETVQRLAGISNIVGIKEALGDVSRIREIIERCSGRLDVFSGDDATAMESMMAGSKGVISVTANVTPRAMHELCLAAIGGDRPNAEKIDNQLKELHNALFLESNPIPVKWALHEMGIIPEGIRLPLTPLSEKFRAPLRRVLVNAGLL